MSSVVFFSPSDTWGGVEKNILVRATFLSENKHKVYIILLKGLFAEKFDKLPNVTVINVSKRGGDINVFVLYQYIKILKKIKPDVVFAASKKDWFLVSLSSRIAKVKKLILYLGIKRKIKSSLKYKFVFHYLKPITIVNSDSLKEYLLETTSFFNSKNLFRIYNGFKSPIKNNSLKNSFLKELKLAPDTILIGCAGRFSSQKGFDLLPSILDKIPANIHIIHAGSQGDKEKEIKKLIHNSSIKNRVHFLGQVSNMDSFYNKIDIFLLCSRWEGMANVLNEALSYGIPSISTKVDGSKELLANGKYGILTEIDDINEIVLSIKSILNKNHIFNSKDLEQHIQDHFSMEKMILNTEKIFFENKN